MTWKNLSQRQNDGLTVSLDWTPDDGDSPIRVHVESATQDFILYPDPCYALDCFHHPFAYAGAALNGKSVPCK